MNFRLVTSCNVMVGYQRFGTLSCLYLLFALKMEAPSFSETVVSNHKYYTASQPKNLVLNHHRPENLKSCSSLYT